MGDALNAWGKRLPGHGLAQSGDVMELAIANRVLGFAYEDWRAGTSERDQSPDGRLAAIFRDSGFSNAVAYDDAGKVRDWCGMSVGAWMVRAGMPRALRSSFLHCQNVEAFATYGRQNNVNPARLMTEVLVDGVWIPVEEWHEREGEPRVWIPEAELRAGDPAQLDLRLGDIVLIDYQGVFDARPDEKGDKADHITMAAGFWHGVLDVMNGNASGLNVHGKPVGDAVCRTVYDLGSESVLKRLYGVCRPSSLDFLPLEYRR